MSISITELIKDSTHTNHMVLEPLCTATKTLFEFPELADNIVCNIELDESGEDFIVEPFELFAVDENDDGKLCRCGYPKDTWMHNPLSANNHSFYEAHKIQLGDKWYYPKNNLLPYNAKNWVRKVPEREVLKNNNNGWKLAGTDFSALIIQHAWKPFQLHFSDDAKLLYDFLLLRLYKQTKFAANVARFKVEGVLPSLPDEFIDHPELPLAPYQKAAVGLLLKVDGSGLWMEPGTGKTATSIARMMTEARMKQKGLLGNSKVMYRALIVCPNQVRYNWQSEFNRFATLPGKCAVVRGDSLRRQKTIYDSIRQETDCSWSATIIGMDTLGREEVLQSIPWDIVVVDEAHNFKQPSTKRWKALREYVELPNVKSRIELTGTPIPNSLLDLWTQLEFMGKGLSGFKKYDNFRNFYGVFEESYDTAGREHLVSYQNVPLLQERLTRLCYMVTKQEANLQLPDKLEDVIEIEMSSKQSKAYQTLLKTVMLEIEQDLSLIQSGKKTMTAEHVLTKLMRLAQITSGFYTLDPIYNQDTMDLISAKEVIQIDEVNPKVKVIIDSIKEDLYNDKLGKKVIWACFVEDIRILSQELKKAGINHVGYHRMCDIDFRVPTARDAEQKLNCDENCDVFIGNAQSSGEGVNFLGYDRENPDSHNRYVDHMFFMSSNWRAVLRQQAKDRAHRRGSRCPSLRITDIIVPGTVDEEIRNKLLKKQADAATIQDVRQILNALVGFQNG
jgi:SNF2 family DNA or RNA helicase